MTGGSGFDYDEEDCERIPDAMGRIRDTTIIRSVHTHLFLQYSVECQFFTNVSKSSILSLGTSLISQLIKDVHASVPYIFIAIPRRRGVNHLG